MMNDESGAQAFACWGGVAHVFSVLSVLSVVKLFSGEAMTDKFDAISVLIERIYCCLMLPVMVAMAGLVFAAFGAIEGITAAIDAWRADFKRIGRRRS